jgi:hypothetical protein
MSVLPGDRPDRQKNFHGKDGTHLFPHPAQYETRRSLWSAVEKRYAAHLDRHQELASNPEPMDGDPEVVTSLFQHIERLEQIIEKEKKLIIALRQKAAFGADVDDKDGADAKAVRMIVRGGLGS